MPSSYQPHGLFMRNLRRLLVLWGGLLVIGLVLFLLTWRTFYEYVPPGKHLVVIANEGKPLTPGEMLADEGQIGVQRNVLGEGWHFILPIMYSTELKDNTVIPPGKVGILVAKGGKPLPQGRLLGEEGQGEQGIQRQVLHPGSYRLNPYGFDVRMVDATDIKPGFVGVLRRKLGVDGKGRFAETEHDKGILRIVLQPGLYYINTDEYEVVRAEIGIFQTGFRYDPKPKDSTAITFTSKGGFPISLDCTVEWEVRPDDMPSLVAEYGTRHNVEVNVIDVQAHSIGRDKGIDYSAQDFLEGAKRERFQEDFTKELVKKCKDKNVTVHSAFIRNIVIPEEYLKPIRDRQISAEMELTNRAKQATAESDALVEREEQLIQQKVAEVEAETMRLVADLGQKRENLAASTKFEIERMKEEYGAKIADVERERTLAIGEAEANAKKLKETATSELIQKKLEVFQNDANAFLRYSLAKEQMNPDLVLRLFQTGPGTFWTNMDNKSMSLVLPNQGAGATKNATPARTTPPGGATTPGKPAKPADSTKKN